MITALDAANTDKTTWDHPEHFRRERFLDEHGKSCLEKDHSLPFAASKRLCAAETFARNMLFLLTAGLFQNFSIDAPQNDRIPLIRENATGFVKLPSDYWVKLNAR